MTTEEFMEGVLAGIASGELLHTRIFDEHDTDITALLLGSDTVRRNKRKENKREE